MNANIEVMERPDNVRGVVRGAVDATHAWVDIDGFVPHIVEFDAATGRVEVFAQVSPGAWGGWKERWVRANDGWITEDECADEGPKYSLI